MDNMNYALLAFLQGVTEFFPVSSSGHLVFFQELFGFKESMLFFDIIMHLATAVAVIVFLREELILMCNDFLSAVSSYSKGEPVSRIWRSHAYFREFIFVLVALIPLSAGIFLFKPFLERMFSSLVTVGIGFIITGAVLFFTKYFLEERNFSEFNLADAVIIGIVQMLAIVPGISRSGLTISAGTYRGLDKNVAARFSFILAIPTILGAVIYKLKDGVVMSSVSGSDIMTCFVIAFFTGYGALVLLSRLIAMAKLHYFSYYCWTMGVLTLILAMLLNTA